MCTARVTHRAGGRWVIALSELKNLVARSGLPARAAFSVRELCDVSAVPALRKSLITRVA